MIELLRSSLGRLRLLAWLEGATLLILVFVSLPLKYGYGITVVSEIVGPIHGGMFLLFVLGTFSLSVERDWTFRQTTWKLLVACLIPFGTFYIDHRILKPLYANNSYE